MAFQIFIEAALDREYMDIGYPTNELDDIAPVEIWTIILSFITEPMYVGNVRLVSKLMNNIITASLTHLNADKLCSLSFVKQFPKLIALVDEGVSIPIVSHDSISIFKNYIDLSLVFSLDMSLVEAGDDIDEEGLPLDYWHPAYTESREDILDSLDMVLRPDNNLTTLNIQSGYHYVLYHEGTLMLELPAVPITATSEHTVWNLVDFKDLASNLNRVTTLEYYPDNDHNALIRYLPNLNNLRFSVANIDVTREGHIDEEDMKFYKRAFIAIVDRGGDDQSSNKLTLSMPHYSGETSVDGESIGRNIRYHQTLFIFLHALTKLAQKVPQVAACIDEIDIPIQSQLLPEIIRAFPMVKKITMYDSVPKPVLDLLNRKGIIVNIC